MGNLLQVRMSEELLRDVQAIQDCLGQAKVTTRSDAVRFAAALAAQMIREGYHPLEALPALREADPEYQRRQTERLREAAAMFEGIAAELDARKGASDG